MSNVSSSASSSSVVVGAVAIPATATKPQARAVAKALMQWAGEGALSAGKVSDELTYAYGVALAILGAADNQAAPLERIRGRIGPKPNKAQAARLTYWANCTAAGRAAFCSKADDVALADIIGHHQVAAMSAAALAADAAAAAARKKAEAEAAANKKRAAAVAAKAAENAAALLDAAVAAAYRDVAAHGGAMDNAAARAHFAAVEKAEAAAVARAEAAAVARARIAAWREKQAAARLADAVTNKAIAAAQLRQLADALGIRLSAAQLRQLADAEAAHVAVAV